MTQRLLILALGLQAFLFAQVSSIRVSTDNSGVTVSPWGSAAFAARNMRLDLLVSLAYNVSDNQISGVDRLGSSHYDVSIKPESGAMTYERTLPMLRALLEERFKLVVHRETKQTAGYILVIARGGPKLKESAPDARSTGMISNGRIVGSQMPLDTIAAFLSRPLKQPVVNKTGIPGKYDLDLSYAREGAEPSTDTPSIFTAVQEQLGLKLESQKVPLETLVIDSVNPVPTEN